jgi:hypothetical protein
MRREDLLNDLIEDILEDLLDNLLYEELCKKRKAYGKIMSMKLGKGRRLWT